MCGFVGLVDKNNVKGKHTPFMNYALKDLSRRGPDSQHKWISKDGIVEFGFARLAIRDLSEAGSQPMQSNSGRYSIVYNGETYNTNELCSWANINKTKLKGHSDTEIILACVEEKGFNETINMMDGIFAVALHDSQTSKLYLARDHAGVKPLYLGINANGVVFSSHYHHITSHSFFKDEKINNNAIANYFKYGFIQEGEGILENTYFFPHAHIGIIDLISMQWNCKPYFELNHNKKSTATLVDIKHAYSVVVKSQLVSDVPIGCFLSGGVDSTITTGIASQFLSNLTAYTIGVDDEKLDETNEAKRFANYFNINHVLHSITSNDILDVLNEYTESMGEPLADSSSLLTLKVCELAKKKLTVVLSGDGGDELFWGYPRFQKANMYKKILNTPQWLRFIKILLQKLQGKKMPFDLLYFKNFDDYYLAKQGLTGNAIWVEKLLNLENKIKNPYLVDLSQKRQIHHEMDLAKQLEYDIHMQRVLLKVDRASMYHSLEVRTPMLSKKFVEFSMRYFYQECVNEQEGKLPLRKLLQHIIPKHEKNSGEKKGFSPPIAMWMRNELKQKIQERIEKVPEKLKHIINVSYIDNLWQSHLEKKADNSWPLWAIFSLFTWVDNKMNSNAH
jgi:asparagine synthase (glutamine-hydrolysing)